MVDNSVGRVGHRAERLELRSCRRSVAWRRVEGRRPCLGHDYIDRDACRLGSARAYVGADDHMRCRSYALGVLRDGDNRSEDYTSELQSLIRISYDESCLKNKS